MYDVMRVRLGIGKCNVRCHACETRNRVVYDVMRVRLGIGKCTSVLSVK